MEPDPDAAARAAGSWLARHAASAVAARGRALIGISGGSSVAALAELAHAPAVAWPRVVFVQLDERVAPDGDPARNASGQRQALEPALASRARLVELVAGGDLPDTERIGRSRARLARAAGCPAVLDIAQLGLGADGHTASLVPGDPVLTAVTPVAMTGQYRGHRRLTVTHPVLARARQRLWFVTGSDKSDALAALRAGEGEDPAVAVNRRATVVFADRAAADR